MGYWITIKSIRNSWHGYWMHSLTLPSLAKQYIYIYTIPRVSTEPASSEWSRHLVQSNMLSTAKQHPTQKPRDRFSQQLPKKHVSSQGFSHVLNPGSQTFYVAHTESKRNLKHSILFDAFWRSFLDALPKNISLVTALVWSCCVLPSCFKHVGMLEVQGPNFLVAKIEKRTLTRCPVQ